MAAAYKLEPENRERLKQVSTATLTTVLFKCGFRNVFLRNVHPLNPHATRLVGEAYTALHSFTGRPDSFTGRPGYARRISRPQSPAPGGGGDYGAGVKDSRALVGIAHAVVGAGRPAHSISSRSNAGEIRGPSGPQHVTLPPFPWLTVQKNVEFGLKFRGRAPVTTHEIARKYIAEVVWPASRRFFRRSCREAMQRVAIAGSLANDPAVLLTDAPFGALDAKTRVAMGELMLTVWERDAKTVLFVTHNIEEALILADGVRMMTSRLGRIRQEIEVALPRPRTSEMLISEVFLRQQALVIREESGFAAYSGCGLS
jgi:ABC-type taurine transport system ATPase subunit